MKTTPKFEHLFPYSTTSDFVLKRTIWVGDKAFSVLVIGNYGPYVNRALDVLGVAIAVDGERTYLAGGHHTLAEALAGARGVLGALLAVKQEQGEIVEWDETDIVNFVLKRGELDDETKNDEYLKLRRQAGY